MTTIAASRRHSDNLTQRWLRTGGNHARTDPSSHHQTKPATATLKHHLDHQAKLLLSARRLISHLEGFTRGVIDTKDIVYFLSVTFLGLFLTSRSLESLRWRA